MHSSKVPADLSTNPLALGVVSGERTSGGKWHSRRWKSIAVGTVILVLVALQLRTTNFSVRTWGSSCQNNRIDVETLGEVEDGKLGAVASESAVCSRHGTDMLRIGGNAADAVSFVCSNSIQVTFWPF